MTTAVGREIAARVNAEIDASERQSRRLVEVIRRFCLFADAAQLDLSETAIIWACAALARHERRDACESYFYAFADALYASTDDGIDSLSESARKQMLVDASALQQSLLPLVNEVLRESLKKLAVYAPENTFRVTAEALHHVRKSDLEHAPREYLQNLTVHCVMLSDKLDDYDLGSSSEQDVSSEVAAVSDFCIKIMHFVRDAIRAGKLIVKDGKVVAAGQAGA